LIYLRQEGRGIGLYSKMDAYRLQDEGLDTFAANRALGFADDERDFHVAAQMLRALGVREVTLLTNNTHKVEQLVSGGVRVRDRVSTGVYPTPTNAKYLRAKARAGHLIDLANLA
jgi:GTP cyclohydrolase II